MRTRSLLLSLCVGAACIATGCSEEQLAPEQEPDRNNAPFILTATSGTNSQSRLAFQEDGLTLKWEDGDQLIMQDVNGALSPVYLTTSLDEPAESAQFVSDGGVAAGTYYVYYTGKGSAYSMPISITQTPELASSSRLKTQMVLLATLTVTDGQTSASVDLKHIYAKLTINIEDEDNELPASNARVGMFSIQKGLYNKVQIEGADGNLVAQGDRYAKQDLTWYWNGIDKSALIFPNDFTGETVYFYVGYEQNQKIVVYEFAKEGIEIKAGINYNITLNLKDANRFEILGYEISVPEHFRALAYYTGSGRTYTITQDIDFSNIVYFPIEAREITIEGNGHILSNLNINWAFNGTGLFAKVNNIKNLTLQNVNIKGQDKVGAFVGEKGYGALSGCKLTGTNSIIGNSNVGGIIGYGSYTDSDLIVEEGTNVEGIEYVGGIIGYGNEILSSTSAATTTGTKYVGGIAGYAWKLSECGFSGTVLGTGEIVGGIVGECKSAVTQSYNTGEITGITAVGGITGHGSVNLCCSTGNITATNGVAGGLVGDERNVYWTISNSYSLGSVKGNTSGGICGAHTYGIKITNCYSAANVESGNGIIGDGQKSTTITNCLTTSSQFGVIEADAQYVNCTDILANVAVINGDQAYSTTKVWENQAYNCPLLLWQVGSLNIGSGDTKVVAPPFDNVDW